MGNQWQPVSNRPLSTIRNLGQPLRVTWATMGNFFRVYRYPEVAHAADCDHDFGPEERHVTPSGTVLLLAGCSRCNAGTVTLAAAPDLSGAWVREHFEAVP